MSQQRDAAIKFNTDWRTQPFRQVWATAWDVANCHVHGLLKHLLAHEAGHAVFAARHGIEFVEVTVNPPHHSPAFGGGFIGGGVLPLHPHQTWVPGRVEDAFDFFVMGLYTETKFFGDHVPDGYAEDMRQFRRASGLLEATDAATSATMIKESMARLDSGWSQTERDVDAVAQALMDQFDQSLAPRFEDLPGPLVLSSDDVASILQIA